ncbi:MAG: 4Fe-4S binding protein [Rhodocyclales bacterium]|nr:4Fe-4S binding protein [Rhodocyclales bacterium]
MARELTTLAGQTGRCAIWGLVLVMLTAAAAQAGTLSQADLVRRFGPPLRVGEKLREVPAWPLTSELKPDGGPTGYVFESIDIAPIPGFEGTPINLLVAIDAQGTFMDVEVLHQHEPVFLSGLGEAPLREFTRQYTGRSLRQEIAIASAYGDTRSGGGSNRVVLDGVTKATASVRIVNQTVLAAALEVARARLGFAAGGQRGPPAVPRAGRYEPLGFAMLLQRGHIQRLRLSNAEVEQLFSGSAGAGLDDEALKNPQDLFIEIYVAYLNAPTIGRNLLGDAAYRNLMLHLGDGRPAFWVATRGRYALVDEGFVPGTPPPRLALMQGKLPIELRDANRDTPRLAELPELNAALILTVPSTAGLDPGQPMELHFALSRASGLILPVVTHRSAVLRYAPPAALFEYPPKPLPEWLLAWQGRWPDLALIGAALLVLSAVLARPRAVSRHPRRLRAFRLAFLAFTLGYIGWYAQGQLSIVQITGALKSMSAGTGLASFLYDPVSLLLIAFTLLTLAVWGRGVFCGWLCPFGALQEFLALLARRLRIPAWRLPARLAGALDRGRYALLAVLAGAAAMAPSSAEILVEAEPFKTAITVGFAREWPYVAYCIGMLAAGLFIYKFFCRFVCPLGAALTLGGRLRRWNWLARRQECGKPCQRCRHICAYDAIDRDGAIRYDDCFQCLDCVGIYFDDDRCAPMLLSKRKGRRAGPMGSLPAIPASGADVSPENHEAYIR